MRVSFHEVLGKEDCDARIRRDDLRGDIIITIRIGEDRFYNVGELLEVEDVIIVYKGGDTE
jgi:hypothetical protein